MSVFKLRLPFCITRLHAAIFLWKCVIVRVGLMGEYVQALSPPKDIEQFRIFILSRNRNICSCFRSKLSVDFYVQYIHRQYQRTRPRKLDLAAGTSRVYFERSSIAAKSPDWDGMFLPNWLLRHFRRQLCACSAYKVCYISESHERAPSVALSHSFWGMASMFFLFGVTRFC